MRISSVFSIGAFAALVAAGPASAQSAKEPMSPSLPPIAENVAAGPTPAYGWIGTWISNHYVGGYVGAMKALNDADDLWSDGLVLRGDASGGSYRYDSIGFSNVSVGTVDADVMIGFRSKVGKGALSAYIGPSYLVHDNPDPAATLRGTQFGAKILAEYNAPLDDDVDGYAQGSYNTAFATYSLAGRLLYRVSETVWLGPQVTYFGNHAPYQESTFGAYLGWDTEIGQLGLSGGYRHVYTSGHDDGYFASVFLGFPID